MTKQKCSKCYDDEIRKIVNRTFAPKYQTANIHLFVLFFKARWLGHQSQREANEAGPKNGGFLSRSQTRA